MNVAAFGGAGFLGKVVVAQLRSRGHAVQVIEPRAGAGEPYADIREPAALEALSLQPEVVINLAAIVPGPSATPAQMFAVNAVGATNVATWAAQRRVKRMVQCSTLVVCSRPWPVPLTETSPTYPTGPAAAYAASKLAGEIVASTVASAGVREFATLRFAALYGPDMVWTGVLPAFIDAALAGKRLSASRAAADLIHVEDAARAVVAAVEASEAGVFNVASGVETPIAELARLVLDRCGRSPSEMDVTDSAPSRAVVDIARMSAVLGPPRVLLKDGVEELIRWRRERPAP
jgi:UDP-glucose 4-epimerase